MVILWIAVIAILIILGPGDHHDRGGQAAQFLNFYNILMSQNTNTNKRNDKKGKVKIFKPRAPSAAIKKQQELWSWLEFYTKFSSGGDSNKKAAEKCREQLQELENQHPALYKTTFNTISPNSVIASETLKEVVA